MDRLQKLESKVERLESQVQELLGLVKELRGEGPAAEVQEEPRLGGLDQMLEQAPAKLGPRLQPVVARIHQLLQSGELEELVTVKIPELVELCHHERLKSDTGELFYVMADEVLDDLLNQFGVEKIQPSKGEKFLASRHRAVRVTRTQEAGLRDQVELCLNPGFEWNGRLLKKAEVVVFL